MINYLSFFESFDITDVEILKGQKKTFKYSSPTSIHSEVTDWAYGKVLSRECKDISDGKLLKGVFNLTETKGNFFIKVIACMPDWQKYINSFKIVLNDKVVVDTNEAFFENVNLGWPALYFPIKSDLLVKGENKISFSTTNFSKAGLYFSESKILRLPNMKDLTQISSVLKVKEKATFGIAVYNENNLSIKDIKTKNCTLKKSKNFDRILVLSFKAGEKGKSFANIKLGKKRIKLEMPEIVNNKDNFLVGIDSDDHRHDNSEEFRRIPFIFALTGMGNFMQFRPQFTRNFYKLADKNDYKEIIEFLGMFGIKYGLCDSNKKLNYLPKIDSNNFLGYHVHEPYLYFNIISDYDCFFVGSNGNKEMVLSAKSFGQAKKLYISYLNSIIRKLPKNCGLTSTGAPSMLCAYEGDAGFDRITIEPVSNINMLMGTVRATSVKMWGAHLPPDWYFGVPVDKVKANKARLALQYLYLNGASYLYYENAVFKTNAFARCDWESDYCAYNREYLRDFYKYTLENPRKGKLVVDKAVLYGNNEFLMWQTNDRMAELKEKDWDNTVWGKWDNGYQECWHAIKSWLPYSSNQNEIKSPLNKHLFSGTPYGNVDIVSIEKDFTKYKTVALLGWNTMTDDLIEKLKKYVKKGGNLIISYCHFNYTDRNDRKPVFPSADKIKSLLGGEFENKVKISGNLTFDDKTTIKSSGETYVVKGKKVRAEVICKDESGNGVVYKNKYGKGTVYFNAFYEYYGDKFAIDVVSKTLDNVGKQGDIKCNNNDVSFTARDLGNGKYEINVLNMNCIDLDTQNFKIEFMGKKVKGKVKTGEIKKFIV
ncbi:MAG: beta-galactosidase trimerization domain-containing protein [Clostridia bacterium]|nr:beta-galactosidase trimerization domain-containing protein [Clostridia bacterium]